jgi:hypothetical protein
MRLPAAMRKGEIEIKGVNRRPDGVNRSRVFRITNRRSSASDGSIDFDGRRYADRFSPQIGSGYGFATSGD